MSLALFFKKMMPIHSNIWWFCFVCVQLRRRAA